MLGLAGQASRLHSNAMTPDDFPTLQVTLDWTLYEMSRAGADRKSPFRWPVLATGGPAQAQARVVALRSFERGERKALIFTDRRTPKITQLRQNRQATMVFFDPRRMIQIRACGVASVITDGPDHAQAWLNLSAQARRDYTAAQAPGTPVAPPAPATDRLDESSACFAMIEVSVASIDWLLISRRGHKRASFEWAGDRLNQSWLTP